MESVATNDELPSKSSKVSDSLISSDTRRQQFLTNLQSMLRQQASNDQQNQLPMLTKDKFVELFLKEEVLHLLFQLLDYDAEDKLSQTRILDLFKEKLECVNDNEKQRDLINFLDTSFYVHAGDKDLDFGLFMRILKSKRVIEKIYNVINLEQSDVGVSVMNVMSFITNLTYFKRSCDLNAVNWEFADHHFRKMIEEKNGELSLDQFKKMIPCKNPFFAERAFSIFDKDKSGKVSMVEYRETLDQFCSQSEEDKVRFLFKLYDKNGDGLIKLEELKVVLEACVEENGLKFTQIQLDELTQTLYDDAVKCGNTDEMIPMDSEEGIRFEQLKAQMVKHPGLLENLSISLEQFLLPELSKKKLKHTSKTIPKLSFPALRNNAVFFLFVSVYLIVNASLFITRAVEYKDAFILYMLARAAGQCLNFNCAIVVVLMLRHSITWLRMHNVSHFLPLDHHVYLHKMCGTVIVVLGALHGITHIFDFVLNIADQTVPNVTDKICTWWEWLFTSIPGVFGLIPGWACLTGWGILVCLTIMAICSLPFVRRRGSFELFYWTHLLYIPFWILLIIHAPHFWIWFAFPGMLFVIEKMYNLILQWTGNTDTYVKSAAVFSSGVAHLVIKKPSNFKYCPGDYVFVKVKSITSFEWHPFTMSSAPEAPDVIWLHVTCAGGWTKKLYENVKQQVEIEKQKLSVSIDGEISQASNEVDFKGKNQKGEIPSVSKSLENFEISSILCETEQIVQLKHPIEISLDGPYGTPSSRIFQASHAVLIAAGIGVTPFASILQSIMYRHYANQQNGSKKYTMNLKKVDFFWINRDQRCFEWFVHLLSQLEIKQAELGSDRFLDMHMYITSALKNTDMKAVGLQMALDLVYAKGHRDLVTGLKTRTIAGRPNWDKVFEQIFDQNKGKVTIFYCGPPQLGKELKGKCNEFGFNFRKETF